LLLMLVVLVLVLVLVTITGGNTLIDGNPHINKILTTVFIVVPLPVRNER
jgi:hypothetical protein